MNANGWAFLIFTVTVLASAVGLGIALRPPAPVPPAPPVQDGSPELRALVEINRLLLDVVGKMVAPVGAQDPGPGHDDGGWGHEDPSLLLLDPSPDPDLFDPLPETLYDPDMNPHPGFQVEADL